MVERLGVSGVSLRAVDSKGFQALPLPIRLMEELLLTTWDDAKTL